MPQDHKVNAQAINEALKLHFTVEVVPVEGHAKIGLVKIMLPPAPFANYEAQLVGAIESCERMGVKDVKPEHTTVWIEVITDKIPPYVRKALSSDCLQKRPIALIVTHKGATSHDAGNPLGADLALAAAGATRARTVWNPLIEKFIPAKPVISAPPAPLEV